MVDFFMFGIPLVFRFFNKKHVAIDFEFSVGLSGMVDDGHKRGITELKIHSRKYHGKNCYFWKRLFLDSR